MRDNEGIINKQGNKFVINVNKFSDNLVCFRKSNNQGIKEVSRAHLGNFLYDIVDLFNEEKRIELCVGVDLREISSLIDFKKWLYRLSHQGIEEIIDKLDEAVKGILAKYHYEYELKKVECRERIDLQKHKNNIKSAISSIFPNNLINTVVHKNYFEFDLASKAEYKDLREMGKEITAEDRQLDDLKVDYGYSTQLFIRKNNN